MAPPLATLKHMTKPVVLIAEELSPATVAALGPDFEVRNVDGTDRPALLKELATADAILVRSATQVDAEAIAAAPKLKVIARAGVGLDNVDIKAATNAGVMVVNAPTSISFGAFSRFSESPSHSFAMSPTGRATTAVTPSTHPRPSANSDGRPASTSSRPFPKPSGSSPPSLPE